MKRIQIFSLLICSTILLGACGKNWPDRVSGVNINPPPPPPPPPHIFTGPVSGPCNNFWICVSSNFLASVKYMAPNGSTGAFGAIAVTPNRIFFAGGHDELVTGGDINNCAVYDPVNYNWKTASLGVARCYLSGGSTSSKVVFAGGRSSACTYCGPVIYFDEIDVFDIATLDRSNRHLSEARSEMATVSAGNKIYFMGGKNATGYSKKIDVYDGNTDSWSVFDLPQPRGQGGAVVINNKIYVCGGQNSAGPLTVIDVYDIGTNTWSVITAPHEHPVATVIEMNNKLFIAGGDKIQNKNLDIYDVGSATWSDLQLSDARNDIAASAANNKIVFMAGNYSPYIDIYNDLSGTISHGSLDKGITGLSAASSGDKLYFTGFLSDNGNTITNTIVVIEP